MLTAEKAWGGSRFLTTGVDATIFRGICRAWTITTTAPGLKIKAEVPFMPYYKPGGVVFFLWNNGAQNWTFCDAAGTTIAAVNAGQVAAVYLWDMASNGTWSADVRTKV